MFIKRSKYKSKRWLLFFGLVVLPWALVVGYTTTVANPRYVSKSSVIIKQINDSSAGGSGLSALLGVNSTSKEDANFLTEFILSKDMVDNLNEEFKFRQHYRPTGKDFLNELPADATNEEVYAYFKKRVKVSLDELSSVLTVSTEGFDPQYALALNQAILKESEQFINRISRAVAKEQVAFSENQLKTAEERLAVAKQNLLNYQNDNQVLDPKTDADVVNQIISGLKSQLATLRTEERQLLTYLNPEAPQVVSLKSQIGAVEQQIADEEGKLTSGTDSKLNEQTMAFEAIKGDVAFANELYKLSLTAAEQSRLEAIRKMKNLIVITSPHQADEPMYPRKSYIIFTSLAFLLIIYGFVLLIVAVIKDHSK